MADPDRSAKRDAILGAVWGLVAQEGVAAVSFRAVAREADVSVGRIQHYFGTREQLLRASVERLFDLAADHAPDALEGDTATRLRALLAHPIPARPEQRAGASIYFGYLAASVADPAIGALLADAKRGVRDEVAACLREVAGWEAPRAEEEALRLCALADGALMAAFVGSASVDAALAIIDGAVAEVGGRAPGR